MSRSHCHWPEGSSKAFGGNTAAPEDNMQVDTSERTTLHRPGCWKFASGTAGSRGVGGGGANPAPNGGDGGTGHIPTPDGGVGDTGQIPADGVGSGIPNHGGGDSGGGESPTPNGDVDETGHIPTPNGRGGNGGSGGNGGNGGTGDIHTPGDGVKGVGIISGKAIGGIPTPNTSVEDDATSPDEDAATPTLTSM